MTGPGTDIEHRGGDVEDVVDLAGVDQADERVAHDDDLKVGGGEGGGKLGEGVVGEAEEVGVRGGLRVAGCGGGDWILDAGYWILTCGHLLDFGEFAAAADETEDDRRVARQVPSGRPGGPLLFH